MLAEGNALVEICLREDMPAIRTVYRWLMAHDEFRQMYTQAREWQGETMADRAALMATKGSQLIGDPAVARVQLDAIKWAAAKFNKKYSEKYIIPQDEEGNHLIPAFIMRIGDAKT